MTETVPVTTGDIRWQVRPESRDALLGPDGLRLDEWRAAGQAVVVKHGPHRTVYRVTLPGHEFYVKHNRLWNARAWLRQLIRPPKARLEHQRAREVAARGVPTIEVLAIGEGSTRNGPSDSYLITRGLDDTEQLDTFLEATLPTFAACRRTHVRHLLAKLLGAFVARMHDAGITHHDLHPGNLLIRLAEGERPALFLIDLHAVRVGPPLGWPASRDNLVILNHWFTMRAGRGDRLRFWRAYCRARHEVNVFPFAPAIVHGALPVELERRTWLSNLRFWRHRDRRCLCNNKYYQTVHSALATGHAVRDLDPEALALLLADPDGPFEKLEAKLLKNSPSSTVAELVLNVNGQPRPVIYKRFRVTSWKDPWTSLLRRSAALRSWVAGHGLRERCLPTPRPLLVLHRRRAGLSHEGYLLTEKVDAAADLHAFVAGLNSLGDAKRLALLRGRIDRVARLVRELHRRRLGHRDLKAANLLIDGAGHLQLIDLVGVTRYARLPRGRRVQNLMRLNASFHEGNRLTRTDRLRFLRVYLQWGLRGRAGWKRWWQQVEQATADKVAQNARRGRMLA